MIGKIWIDRYWRVRNGKPEHVRGHWRRRPRPRKSAVVLPFPTVA
jgi:hypothetical protein